MSPNVAPAQSTGDPVSPRTPPAPPGKRPVSARRLAANRRNAQKSTGPRTPEGKARSARNARKSTGPRSAAGKARAARNAVRHGFWATDPIPPEDRPAFAEHARHVAREWGLRTAADLAWGEELARVQWVLAALESGRAAACRGTAAGRVSAADLVRFTEAEVRLTGRFLVLVRQRVAADGGNRRTIRRLSERTEPTAGGQSVGVTERTQPTAGGRTLGVTEQTEPTAPAGGATSAVSGHLGEPPGRAAAAAVRRLDSDPGRRTLAGHPEGEFTP